ncbi:MAG: type II toxin-antitoxin system RelE/ParE family toxin [Candidatus Vogelbacteria bacterium]|nr:type II toxin-antitoxin system RelE/ParE family toxin [Candidatus Vogelbacteria bacterium]
MSSLIFGQSFIRSAKLLDKNLQSRLRRSLDLLAKEPFSSLLHTKPLTGELKSFYSFRLGRDYRVIFKFLSAETIHLLKVGHRKNIYR